MHVPLLRQTTEEGWRFVAQPQASGTSWVLQRVRPVSATTAKDSVVYQLSRGATLTDYCSGALLLAFPGGDCIIIDPDGSGSYERADGSIRATLGADGVELEHWLDGPHKVHQSWARVILFDGR